MSIVTKKQALWIVLGCVLTVAAVTAGVEAYKTKMKPIWDYKAYQAKSGTEDFARCVRQHGYDQCAHPN